MFPTEKRAHRACGSVTSPERWRPGQAAGRGSWCDTGSAHSRTRVRTEQRSQSAPHRGAYTGGSQGAVQPLCYAASPSWEILTDVKHRHGSQDSSRLPPFSRVVAGFSFLILLFVFSFAALNGVEHPDCVCIEHSVVLTSRLLSHGSGTCFSPRITQWVSVGTRPPALIPTGRV